MDLQVFKKIVADGLNKHNAFKDAQDFLLQLEGAEQRHSEVKARVDKLLAQEVTLKAAEAEVASMYAAAETEVIKKADRADAARARLLADAQVKADRLMTEANSAVQRVKDTMADHLDKADKAAKKADAAHAEAKKITKDLEDLKATKAKALKALTE